MSQQMAQLQEATIKAHCKLLRMPMVASQFGSLAEQAIREKQSHVGYLEALLAAELEERERNTIERRIREAHLPRVKTLEEFDYTQSPHVTAAKMRTWPRAATSNAPSQCCSLVNVAPVKLICSPVSVWRRAGKNAAPASRLPRGW